MDHDVHLATQGGLQRQLEVPEKVGTPPPPFDARVQRIVESQVRVGNDGLGRRI